MRTNSIALRTLYQAHCGYVTGCLRYWMPGDPAADDISQEVWLALVEHGDELRDPAAIRAWLYTTAIRAALRARRQRERRGTYHIRTSRQSNLLPSPHLSVPPGSPSHEVRALVHDLTDEERELVFLKALQELTWEEVAEAMNARAAALAAHDQNEPRTAYTADALKQRYSRLRQKLGAPISG